MYVLKPSKYFSDIAATFFGPARLTIWDSGSRPQVRNAVSMKLSKYAFALQMFLMYNGESGIF
jgi:hypothetical protein